MCLCVACGVCVWCVMWCVCVWTVVFIYLMIIKIDSIHYPHAQGNWSIADSAGRCIDR